MRQIFAYTTDYLAGPAVTRALDIGCGYGVYAVELARRGVHVTALDCCRQRIKALFYTEKQVREHLSKKRLRDRPLRETPMPYLLGPCKTGHQMNPPVFISSSFAALGSFLIMASRFNASDREKQRSR